MAKDTRNSKILHIATHGYYSTDNIDLTGIAITPAQGDGGFLASEELLSYTFSSDIVVISGCDTALGQPGGGEGMASLGKSFLAQGADNVLSTLWPVSDRASADFMSYFYHFLHQEKQEIAEALRNAQLEMIRQPRYSNPFYWAPYILMSSTVQKKYVVH